MTTKNDYGRPEFVIKLSEWRPEIFFYPDAEIYSFQVLWVDFPKLPLKMDIWRAPNMRQATCLKDEVLKFQ